MKTFKWWAYLIPLVIIFLFFGPLNRDMSEPSEVSTDVVEGLSMGDDMGKYLDGVGSSASPYLIKDEEDLQTLEAAVNAGYSFSGKYFSQTADIDLTGTALEPIGHEESPFRGYYNGRGYTISGLDMSGQDYVGLFGLLEGAVYNLRVEGRVRAQSYAGGIAGRTGKTATILNCFTNVDMEAGSAGGIVGENAGRVISCVAMGSLPEAASGEIAADNTGFYGLCSSRQPLDEGYLCTQTTDDFATEQQKFAQLAGEILNADPTAQAVARLFSGEGTKASPFLIDSVEVLCAFRDLVNGGYVFSGLWLRQTEDLDLAAIDNWEPIGLYDGGYYFDGVYDGAGHVIENLTIDSDGNVGFFGLLGGTVMNLGIESGHVRGACVGSITSHGDGSGNLGIYNCYNRAELYGGTRAGGIADNFAGGTIRNCVNYGEIFQPQTEDATEIASYAGNISHCVVSTREQYKTSILSYSDLLVTEDPAEAAQFLNSDLRSLAEDTGYQNNDFFRWSGDAQAVLTTTADSYTLGFFLRELALILGLGLAAIVAACLLRRRTPRQLVIGARTRWGMLPWHRKVITTSFAITFSLTLLGMFMGDSEVFRSIFWLDSQDTFMDFYNPLITMQKGEILLSDFYNKYTGAYPPIARFFLLAVGEAIPRDLIKSGAFSLRNRTMMLFVMLLAGALIWLYAMIRRRKSAEGGWLFVMVLFCAPMLYAMERGNIILFSFVFSMAFVCTADSEDKRTDHGAAVALSLAAGIKIYPAIYGLLLAARRKWKVAVDTLCWGVSVFLFPFLFTGGFHSLQSFLGSMGTFVGSNQTTGRYWLINYTNIISEISEFTGLPALPAKVVSLSLLVVTGLLALSVFVQKDYWKQVLALSLILVLLPGTNSYYAAIFYCIPLILLYQEQAPGRSMTDRMLVVALCLALVPLQFLCGTYGLSQPQIQFFTGLMGLVMAAIILVDSGMLLLKRVKGGGRYAA